jgi:hypothetical protein
MSLFSLLSIQNSRFRPMSKKVQYAEMDRTAFPGPGSFITGPVGTRSLKHITEFLLLLLLFGL